jgi:Family of unknown function (DUF6502)
MGIFPIYYLSMSRTSAKPSPASVASATSRIPAQAISAVLRNLLRPVIRLALRAGLKYAELDDVLRTALLSEAQVQLGEQLRSNASRLSTMTGLHRKEVSAYLTNSSSLQNELSTQKLSLASRVLFCWARAARKDARTLTLPIIGDTPRSRSFSKLAREVVSDVHFRSILDELVRLGFASESNGTVSLLETDFAPKASSDDRLKLFAQNAAAMLSTGIENVLGDRPPQLEYSIAMRNVSHADAERLSMLARTCWRNTQTVLHDAIVATPEATNERQPACVFRTGVYVNFEAPN